jgi:hypothetical protein
VKGTIVKDAAFRTQLKEKATRNPDGHRGIGRDAMNSDEEEVRDCFEGFFNFNLFPKNRAARIGDSWIDSSGTSTASTSHIFPRIKQIRYSIDTCRSATGVECDRWIIREVRSPWMLNEEPSKRQSFGTSEHIFLIRKSDGCLVQWDLKSSMIRRKSPGIGNAEDILREICIEPVREDGLWYIHRSVRVYLAGESR